MRFKSILSALLAILLLSVSCAGPACAAGCDLKALPSIEIGQNHQDYPSSGVLDDAAPGDCDGCDGMDVGGAEKVANPSRAVSMGGCCHHQVCGHNDIAAIISPSHQIEQPPAVFVAMVLFDRTDVLSVFPLDLVSHSPPLSPPKRNAILRI